MTKKPRRPRDSRYSLADYAKDEEPRQSPEPTERKRHRIRELTDEEVAQRLATSARHGGNDGTSGT